MDIRLTPEQRAAQEQFRRFVDEQVIPLADEQDREGCLSPAFIRAIATGGHLGMAVPEEFGGQGGDMVTLGLLCEQFGRGSASLCALITVHEMVMQTLLRWGSSDQQDRWLPLLARGDAIGAFALSEPDIGSDAKSVATTAVADRGNFVLNGTKRWISFGQIADLLVVVAQCEDKPAAFLVETDRSGYSALPIADMLGFRSAMLAEITLEDCEIPKENLLGAIGFGFSHVAGTALDVGRFCVGWGCVGMARACLDASLLYSKQRKQFGALLRKHQLIQAMIADMVTDLSAARLLCYNAARAKDEGDFGSIMDACIAKYFASKMVNRAATNAVQIHGANGCSSDYPVQRFFRDARIMEIIEGSSQMQQVMIAHQAYQAALAN